MKMKSLTLVLLLTVAMANVGSAFDFKVIRKIYNECLKKERMTNGEAMAFVKAGKWKKVMCIQACVLESLTILRPDGSLDLEEMEFFLSKTIDTMVDVCIDCALTVDGDRCSIIQSFYDCVMENTLGDTVL